MGRESMATSVLTQLERTGLYSGQLRFKQIHDSTHFTFTLFNSWVFNEAICTPDLLW